MAFDRNKNHGTIHGGTDGVAFEQDGKFYDNAGNEVKAQGEEKPKASKTKITPPPATEADAAAAAALAQANQE